MGKPRKPKPIDESAVPGIDSPLDVSSPLATDAPAEAGPSFVAISLRAPMLDGDPAGYCPQHVDCQFRGGLAITLRRLYDGLDAVGARLADGKRIAGGVDAIRWLLEQLEDTSEGTPIAFPEPAQVSAGEPAPAATETAANPPAEGANAPQPDA